MKKISVIVLTKNEEKYIGSCLSLLRKQEIPCEIVLVDGHSTDSTVKIAKKYADKIVYDHGKGISDARNVGWESASREIVAYCDSDSLPPKDWTRNILKNIEGKFAVSGPLIAYDGRFWTKICFLVWSNLFPRFMAKIGYHSVWGANMAFRKSVLRKFPFRCKFLEDYDMGIQLRKTFRVKFSGDLKLPVSSRRFDKGFCRTCIKYYLREWWRRKMRRGSTVGYF